MLRLVIDTNIWIRILLRGRVTLPILTIWQANQFQLVTSQPLLNEYNHVWQRSRLQKYIDPQQAEKLYRQMRTRGEIVELQTIPPRCRDPKDHPVLATAIDGRANAIITGDDDLRADEELRKAMGEYGVLFWGVQSLLDALANE
ncbi:MAG TPA: putative toxin-antitoxin system toxin component, PIN family [Chloroflexota bacterium]|nr:putative toxin-antitoxin system toxin component, PIN family [Chloroflexota bacterium]HUM68116.1 putative toxin-antitoxin system toxin component, PIN family [Chloroflexota bacterium]